MVDLVNDVLRKRKASSPVGWESFARHLRHLNTPMELRPLHFGFALAKLHSGESRSETS